MHYSEINSERQFKDATGYSKNSFSKLLKDYEKTFFEEYGRTYEEYINEEVFTPPKLKALGECLFFVLFQLKNGLIWGSLGYIFRMAGPPAHDNSKVFLNLPELALEKKKWCPKEDLRAPLGLGNIWKVLTKLFSMALKT